MVFMKKKPNPKPARSSQALRLVGCKHYSQCLDIAVERWWPSWSCEGCMAFEPEDRELPYQRSDSTDTYDLPDLPVK